MGMDVYGKNPVNETGQYFRRNVWGWRPLWNYVEEVHPEIAELVEYGYSNDGDGLGARNSKKLAKLLREDIFRGVVDNYIETRNKYLAELPKVDCQLCEGTGIRKDPIGVQYGMPEQELPLELQIMLGRKNGTCNGCNSQGLKDDWALSYDLEANDIAEFADFLENCGGFEIC